MELQSLELVDGALGASAHFKTQTSGGSREEEWGRERPQPDVGLPPTAIGQGRVETHMGFTNDPGGRGFQEAGDVALPTPLHSTLPSPCLLPCWAGCRALGSFNISLVWTTSLGQNCLLGFHPLGWWGRERDFAHSLLESLEPQMCPGTPKAESPKVLPVSSPHPTTYHISPLRG